MSTCRLLPLLLVTSLLSACTAARAPTTLAGLAVEEHPLLEAPALDPLAFKPVDASMDEVLAVHAAQRSQLLPNDSLLLGGHHALRVTLGDGILTATEYYSADGTTGWVAVTRGDQELYRIDTGSASPIAALRGLWTYDGHWVLETAYITPDSFAGRLSLDGALLVPREGYEEAFNFQLLDGKPFHFFRKGDWIGLSYDGREAGGLYDEIPHYQCCSASALNPIQAQSMLAFFARRDAVWYYVEIGAFKD